MTRRNLFKCILGGIGTIFCPKSEKRLYNPHMPKKNIQTTTEDCHYIYVRYIDSGGNNNAAFTFLEDSDENIYTWEDGEPL
jgi:hypothetical protein